MADSIFAQMCQQNGTFKDIAQAVDNICYQQQNKQTVTITQQTLAKHINILNNLHLLTQFVDLTYYYQPQIVDIQYSVYQYEDNQHLRTFPSNQGHPSIYNDRHVVRADTNVTNEEDVDCNDGTYAYVSYDLIVTNPWYQNQ